MSDIQQKYSGLWLHHGEWHGKNFSHELTEYDHDESPGASGSTPMRHAHIVRGEERIAVWVPAGWTDDEARAALEANW